MPRTFLKKAMVCSLILLLVIVCSTPLLSASAASTTTLIQGVWYNGAGFTNTDTTSTFIFTLNKPGYLELNSRVYMDSIHLKLYTNDMTQVISDFGNSWLGGTQDIPVMRTTAQYLEAGTYRLVASKRSHNGKFDVQYKFTAANNTEAEPNNSASQAQLLSAGMTVKGLFSYQDTTDYYHIVLSKPGYLSLNSRVYMDSIHLKLYTSDMAKVISDYGNSWLGGTPEIPAMRTTAQYLEAGTYYMVASRRSHNGTYDIWMTFDASNNNEKEPNNNAQTAMTLATNPPQTVRGLISWQDETDYYRIDLPATTNLSLTLWTYMDSIYAKLYSSDMTKVLLDMSGSWLKGTQASPHSSNKTVALPAGTYYWMITKRSHYGFYETKAEPFMTVTKVSLNASTLNLNVGKTSTLTATVTPSNASNKTINWSTSNSGVASVSSSGVVTAKSPGTATIKATSASDPGVSASCTVTVVRPVTGVSISRDTLSLNTGSGAYLSATVSPSNATNKGITWTSSNLAVAKVSASGYVSGLSTGTATITASAAGDASFKATCKVTVTQKLVTSISITLSSKQLLVGQQVSLRTTILPSDAFNRKLKWSSTNSRVASVSDGGMVSAKKAGKATVTAKATDGSGVSAKVTITVKQGVKKLTLNKKTLSLKRKAKYTLKPKITPAAASWVKLKWTSSNTRIAKVNAKGVVTGVKKGTVYIYCWAQDGSGKYAYCKVTVK